MQTALSFERSRALQEKAHRLIPGGCHTYSKGDDQFPQLSPGFLVRGEGCRVWDADGNEFVDWGMGLRSVILGYGHPAVTAAVLEQVRLGTNFTRPAPLEVDLAECLPGLIPSAGMVKFAKNGSDVTSAAIRLARAFTGRERVALCQDNPFFAFYDWFIGTTPPRAGVPEAVQALSLTFRYNDLDSLRALFDTHAGEIAAVILEPVSTVPPEPGFLEGVQRLTREAGALLVFDEMISGFRWHLQGAQTLFGVTPDLSTFGKAIGNGYSVAVLAGRADVMALGGLNHAREKVFLLSSTHGAETVGLAAGLATIRTMQTHPVVDHLWRIGRDLQDGINSLARARGLADHVHCDGYPCSPYVVCEDGPAYRTLLLQETIRHGVLMPYLAVSWAHRADDVARTLDAVDQALAVYARALDEGIEHHLVGPAVKPVFRKYN